MKKLLIITSAILALSGTNVMAADTTKNETLGQRIDDAKIVTVVNADLVKDKELSAIKINVDSTQGNVVLRGTAPNPAARDRAESIAKSVKGVVKVDNQLTLAPATTSSTYDNAKNEVSQTAHDMNTSAKNTANKVGAKMDDAAINVAVNSGLAGDSELSALKINVDVKNGHVWLKGTAPNSAAKKRATDIAEKVDGVTKVTNQLVVGK